MGLYKIKRIIDILSGSKIAEHLVNIMPPFYFLLLRRFIKRTKHIDIKTYSKPSYKQDEKSYANSPEDKLYESKLHDSIFDADDYENECKNPYHSSKVKYLFPIIESLFSSNHSVSLVDIGCGKGFTLNVLKQKFNNIRLLGIELSYAGCKIIKNNLSLPIIQGDAENLPIANSFFDVALHIATLHHFYRYPERILQETYRILKDEGYLFITDPNIMDVDIKKLEKVMRIKKHLKAIVDILLELENIAVPKRKRGPKCDSVTEKPIPVEFVIEKLKSCNFDIIEQGYINYTTFTVSAYPIGWDIATVIDEYIKRSAPKAAEQFYVIAKKHMSSP